MLKLGLKIGICATALAAAATAPCTYTFTDLGANCYAYGVNDSGVVVGYEIVGGVKKARYWISGSKHNVPGISGYAWPSSDAISINDSNVDDDLLVGTVNFTTGPKLFTYRIGQQYSKLGPSLVSFTPISDTVSIGSCWGFGVDNNDNVCGWSSSAQSVYYFKMPVSTAPDEPANRCRTNDDTTLHTWFFYQGGISVDTGNIICNRYNDSNPNHAFITGNVKHSLPPYYSFDGFMKALVTVGSNTPVTGSISENMYGTAVNISGYCAAQDVNLSGEPVPYYVAGGIATQIADTGTAHGINNSSVVVGSTGIDQYSYDADAYKWSGGTLTDLNTVTTGIPSGWNLYSARDINNSGKIVGMAAAPNPNGPGYIIHAFVLTP